MPVPPPPEGVRDALPLRPADYFILTVLLDGDRHGYAVSKEVERITDGGVRLDAGNMYRTIRRLVRAGWMEPAERRPTGEGDDERRRYYRITALGRSVVAAEVERMRRVVAAADRRHANPPVST